MPYKHQLLGIPTAISVASTAAAERERARASSVNSQTAPTVPATPNPPFISAPAPAISSTLLTHAASMRDPPLHQLYPSPQARPMQARRDSASSTSGLSSVSGSLRAKASSINYQSGLSRSMRAQAEAPRVS